MPPFTPKSFTGIYITGTTYLSGFRLFIFPAHPAGEKVQRLFLFFLSFPTGGFGKFGGRREKVKHIGIS